MKILQERDKGNSPLLFVMGKKEKTGTGGERTAMSEERKDSKGLLRCSHGPSQNKSKSMRETENSFKRQREQWVSMADLSQTEYLKF